MALTGQDKLSGPETPRCIMNDFDSDTDDTLNIVPRPDGKMSHGEHKEPSYSETAVNHTYDVEKFQTFSPVTSPLTPRTRILSILVENGCARFTVNGTNAYVSVVTCLHCGHSDRVKQDVVPRLSFHNVVSGMTTEMVIVSQQHSHIPKLPKHYDTDIRKTSVSGFEKTSVCERKMGSVDGAFFKTPPVKYPWHEENRWNTLFAVSGAGVIFFICSGLGSGVGYSSYAHEKATG